VVRASDERAAERARRGGRSAEPDGWGIVPAYEDAFGTWTEVPASTVGALIGRDGRPTG
jgi:hypothetical protein